MPGDILIVDDEQDIRLLVAGILEDEGYRPCVAADSAAALAGLGPRAPVSGPLALPMGPVHGPGP